MTKAIRRKGLLSWRRLLLLLLALILGLLATMVSRTQMPEPTAPPRAKEALAARKVMQRMRNTKARAGVQPVRLSWEELDSLAKLGGRAVGITNSRIERDGDRVRATGSVKLPLGLWGNGTLWATPAENGVPVLAGKVGGLSLPPFATSGLIRLARYVLRKRGIDVPPPEKLVQNLTLSDDGIVATLDLNRNSRLLQLAANARLSPVDPAAVDRAYCAQVASQKASPTTDFPTLVRRSFASDGDARAKLVALAMLAVSPKAKRLVGSGRPGCKAAPLDPLLLGRADLAKHWALSAALSAAYGRDVSDAIGVWKEVSDSAPSGSGFSYVDLAADRSGTRIATCLSNAETASSTARWLAKAKAEDLMPIGKLALAEGLSEAEFAKRYTSIESTAYATIVAHIDQTLGKACPQ